MVDSTGQLIAFSIFYGLNWLSTVPAASTLAADLFGKHNSGVVFGWTFFANQTGADFASYGASFFRAMTGDYTLAATGLLPCLTLEGDSPNRLGAIPRRPMPIRGRLKMYALEGIAIMTDNVENLVGEPLRAIRAALGDRGDRLKRIELPLAAMKQTLGSLYALSSSDRETITSVIRRVERIERRLDFPIIRSDPPKRLKRRRNGLY